MATFEQDKNAIIGILQFTQKLLPHLIEQLDEPDKTRFKTAWDEQVSSQLVDVITQIQAIQTSGSELWTRLVTAGSSGPSLDLKRHRLADSAGKGLRKRFLRILNSWLGSLAHAIPGVHPVKELKELLEDFFEDAPEPDTGLMTLFNAGGYVPFGFPG